jgi:ribosomal-protein-alanine N-acetyltransferase
VGFAAYRSVTEDAELLNLAVTPGQQRRGVGSALVRAGVERLREKGARRVWLEVRESNHGAREFYRRIGFVQQGRRPDYYNDPCEDALLLELEFQRQSSQLLGRR